MEPTGNHYSRLWFTNRSRDMFKMRLGLGTVLEQSGDSWIEKPSGSSLCRKSLWQYVLCQVETGALPKHSAIAKELIEYCELLKAQTDAQGEPLLHGKHTQSKLMAKVANLLFRELVKAFC